LLPEAAPEVAKLAAGVIAPIFFSGQINDLGPNLEKAADG
jgi:hypothetical protein